MIGQALLSGLGSLGNYASSFFNSAAPAFAVSGVPTSYGRVSPNMDVTKINPRNMTAQNVGEALGMNNNDDDGFTDVITSSVKQVLTSSYHSGEILQRRLVLGLS